MGWKNIYNRVACKNISLKEKHHLLYSLETMRLDGSPTVALAFLLIPDNSSSLQVLFLFCGETNHM